MKNLFRKNYLEVTYHANDVKEISSVIEDSGYEVVGATKYNADTMRVTETVAPKNPLRHARVHDLTDKFDKLGLAKRTNVCWC